MNVKKIKLIELILVLLIAFWQSAYIAIYTFISGKPLNFSLINANYYIASFINAILAIALMFYVIYKNGNTGNYIGFSFSFKWKDLLHGLGLYVSFVCIQTIIVFVLNRIAPSFIQSALHPKNVDFFRNKNYILFIILLAVIIPVKEELIVRGFTMTEVLDLTKSKYLSVILSVLIQFSYHLYQGLPSALLLLIPFSIFALYFSKYKNLNAVVYAHIFIDIISTAIFYFKK